MSFDESSRQQGVSRSAWPAAALQPDEPGSWSTADLLRLFVVPTVVALCFVGGVYWLRLQLPAGSAGQGEPSIVQVHLVPRPDPVSIPVAVASQPEAASISRTEARVDDPYPTRFDDAAIKPMDRAPSSPEAPAQSVTTTPSSMNAPPSSAAVKFQQALFRHIARYQRYPSAARLQQLQGTVETVFSMKRDGSLLGVWVKTTSGQALLDKEAIETIRRAQPLPPIPSNLPERLNIQVLLEFDPS
jgi:protein TonB